MPNESVSLIASAPVFPVDNAVQSAEYYRDKLAFEIVFLYGEPPFFAIVQRGDVAIHLSEREDTGKEITPCTVYVFVDDVDTLYDEFAGRGLEIFSAPEDQDYGMREFEVQDPNGHFLVFGQGLNEE